MFQAEVPTPMPLPPRSFDHVIAFTVLPPVAVAVPVRLREAFVAVKVPVVVGVEIVTAGAVRLAPVGTFQRQSFNVVTPPSVAQLEPVEIAKNSVESPFTVALVTDQFPVPVASE